MGSVREEVDEMLIRFKVLVDLRFHFLWKVSVKTCAPPFCCVLCGHDISIYFTIVSFVHLEFFFVVRL